jgi:hypothetical protein
MFAMLPSLAIIGQTPRVDVGDDAVFHPSRKRRGADQCSISETSRSHRV